jgi:hypothetical protein
LPQKQTNTYTYENKNHFFCHAFSYYAHRPEGREEAKEAVIVECTLISDIDQLCTIIERQGITEIKGNIEIQTSHLGNIARQLSLTKGKPVKITIKTEKG